MQLSSLGAKASLLGKKALVGAHARLRGGAGDDADAAAAAADETAADEADVRTVPAAGMAVHYSRCPVCACLRIRVRVDLQEDAAAPLVPLFPPNELYHIVRVRDDLVQVVRSGHEAFSFIELCPSMLADHSLDRYVNLLTAALRHATATAAVPAGS